MDPLSISASCIAILGALATSAKGLHRLIALRDAPEEMRHLSNELESLRLLTAQIQQCFLSIHGSQAYHDHQEAASQLLERMRRPVDEMRTFIEFQLKRTSKDGLSTTLSKKEWLKANGRIEGHRRRICDARNNLTASMTAIGLQFTGQHYALQLQSISGGQNRHACPASSPEERPLTCPAIFPQASCFLPSLEAVSSGANHQTIARPPEYHHSGSMASASSDRNPVNGQISSPTAGDTSRYSRQTASPDLSLQCTMASQTMLCPPESMGRPGHLQPYMRFRATWNTQPCPKLCGCQCHVPVSSQTPRLLKNVVGQLFFSYTGLLRTTPCNYPPCRERVNKVQLT